MTTLSNTQNIHFSIKSSRLRCSCAGIVERSEVFFCVFCVFCIFCMQLFASVMRSRTLIFAGTDVSTIVPSLSNAIMIATFNFAWRGIAIKLSNWENYRLTDRMRARLAIGPGRRSSLRNGPQTDRPCS